MQTNQLFNCPARTRNARGFTLIELMVVVAIVGILASVAYPSFMGQVRKSRRSDAVAALSAVQQAQERYRANIPNYVTTASLLTTAAPGGLNFRATELSEGSYYSISVSTNSATGCTTGSCYTTTATAVSGKSQANDTGCTTLTVAVSNGTATNTPTACWSN